jgi:hypothetical protein
MTLQLLALSEAERRVEMLADLAAMLRDKPSVSADISRDLSVAEMDLAYLRSGWDVCR